MLIISSDTVGGAALSTGSSSSTANPSAAALPTRTRIVTELASGGTPLELQPSSGGTYEVSGGTFTIRPGCGRISVRVTIDDSGTLSIRDAAGNSVYSLAGGLGDWRKTRSATTWHAEGTTTLPAGTYSVVGSVTNAEMGAYNDENLAYFRYEIEAEYYVDINDDDEVDDDREAEPAVCDTCACRLDRGSETLPPTDAAPDSPDEECGARVYASGVEPLDTDAPEGSSPSPAQRTLLRYDSVWQWKAQLGQDGLLTIRPTSGRSMRFGIAAGSAAAHPVGFSRHLSMRVELLNADFSACTTDSPAYWALTDAEGRRVFFDTADGSVAAQRSASGRLTSRAQHEAVVQTRFDAEGRLLSCYSPAGGLMLVSTADDGAALLSWYAPAQVSTDDAGNYLTTGEPYKTSSHRMTVTDDVESVIVTRTQAGLPPHTTTYTATVDTVTMIEGSGDDAIIRTLHTTHPSVGVTERVETLRRQSDAEEAAPAACTCVVRKLTEGGWLTLSETEGYGTPQARTTSYDYNLLFRPSRSERSDGGYTEYSYDEEGRVTQEISPWGNGGKQRTRYVYATASARFYDNRPVKVYTDYQEAGSNSWLNIKVTDYTYEDSAAAERRSARTYAAGISHQQVTIEENYGEAPACAYAAGKPKFRQDVNGVQTFHEYAVTTEHGAMHKHTAITKANGALVAAQSRMTESFIAADGTTSFEQESIWNGTEWLLLHTTAYEYDEQQRVTKTTRGNGRFSTTAWMCCGRLRETDEDGITTTYGYNSAHQLVETIRSEVKDGEVVVTPETITSYTRDAAGRTLTTRRDVGAMTTTESTEYDILGRVTRQTDILGRITTTTYSADGLTTTSTTPAGATTITLRHVDGSLQCVSGTAQRELHYSYTRSGNNLATTVTLADGSILSQSITNGFEQSVAEATPNTLGGFIYTRSEYNAGGQMVKQYQDTGSGTAPTAPTLYEYDSFGNVTKQTLALTSSPTPQNSPIVELAYSVESTDEGVFSVMTQTHYNATGAPLVRVQKSLISGLSATLESKNLTIDERNLTSTQWVEYNNGTKRTLYNSLPDSSITAEAVSVDAFVLSQTDNAGITTTATRSYTANGMTLTQTDGRGNTTTTVTDKAGRTLTVTDSAGNVTTTVYDSAHDLPATLTDALGNTSCYRYDARGRKVAEWGSAVQPACFGYDDADRMTSLTTFRAEMETISTDPSERTDTDVTTWSYHDTSGMEIAKTYADNSSVSKTYDAYNRVLTETDARGKVKAHTYEHARGLHVGTTYSDGTTARQFSYNHLGQLTQVTDAAGVRTLSYNAYGEPESDSLVADSVTHLITETRDDKGRSTGYTYAKNGTVQQTVTTGYGSDGRISSAGFLHGGAEKVFGYEYLAGSHLLHRLTKPNGMTLTQSYESQRNLLTDMAYHRSTTLVAQREYTYDTLGRPTVRNTSRQGTVKNDSFGYNNRSELTSATISGSNYAYAYDNIGNRNTATEGEDITNYSAHNLNQYTAVGDFTPTFDADGNQTLVKTSTGTWSVTYDAENRPVSFSNAETNTLIECSYDHMGRRATKKVTVDGAITLHQRYIYRGYLQIACCDLTRANHPALWLITWDPTQSIATRPLAIQKDGTWYTYGWDLTKNICELYGSNGYIRTAYTYSPYGSVTESGNTRQPIQWSSEYNDTELGLVYYNYRHYNPLDGRWLRRDVQIDNNHYNLYHFVNNNTLRNTDYIGLLGITLQYILIDGTYFDKAHAVTFLYVSNPINIILEGLFKVVIPIERSHEFNPNEFCCKYVCIEKIVIYAHGYYNPKEEHVVMQLNYDGYIDNMIESSYYKEISDFINNQNIKFCKDAKLIFNVCELGKFGGLKKRIEEYYKNRGVNLNVKTYPTKVTPFGTPMIDSKKRR